MTFRSHIDGSKHLFTPEKVVDIQRSIGSDIMMALDECPPGQSDYQYAKKSLGLTQRWLERCMKRFNETEPLYGYNQTLFPIVQGCTYKDLRQDAAKHVCDILGQLNDGEQCLMIAIQRFRFIKALHTALQPTLGQAQ